MDAVGQWIDGYVRAWNSNDPADIGGLFSTDACYYTEPYAEPWRGRDEIVAKWLERQDEPGETEFSWRSVVVADGVAIVQGSTRYPDQTFSNLWVIRLDETGCCMEFTEWWMEHPGGTVRV